jgi:hypothetical protein
MASHEPFGHFQPKLWVKEGIDLFPTCALGVRHGVEKLSLRATTLVQTSSRSKVGARRYEALKSRDSNPRQFRDSTLGVPGKKSHSVATPVGKCKEYYREYGGGISRVRAVVFLVNPS